MAGCGTAAQHVGVGVHLHTLDSHSKHARLSEWGRMLFYVNQFSTVNDPDALYAAFVNSPFPPMLSPCSSPCYRRTGTGTRSTPVRAG